ncbi:MAG: AtpZ/AtpI family protein [Proteobacteria bacterium]|nr:AtpZ/AtpI family protein [Pseudomonadota bacterium]
MYHRNLEKPSGFRQLTATTATAPSAAAADDIRAETMEKKKPGKMRYMQYSTIGIEMALAVVVGALFGNWLDGKLGTEPWMFIFWLLCGVFAGFRSLYRMAKKIMKETKEDEHQGSD